MSDGSQIQWTDATWNPTTGCTKVSPGCAHCYIERTPAFRIHGRKFVNGATDLRLHANRLDQPLRWRKPRRVFVNSLSDLFHDDVPDAFIDRVFAVMALCPQHTFQVLTKRAERMRGYLQGLTARLGDLWDLTNQPTWITLPAGRSFPRYPDNWPLLNCWLGVSVENQRWKTRIDELRETPAAVRFLSIEPLLEDIGALDLRSINWVIVGGESGPGARVFEVSWARAIVSQCQLAGVACFVKQLGADVRDAAANRDMWPAGEELPDKRWLPVVGDRKGGDMAEWPEDLRVRQFPASWSTTPARSSKERTTKR